MPFLNQELKKLLAMSPVVLYAVEPFKAGTSVKWNNIPFTNVPCFTLFHVFGTNSALPCSVLLPLPCCENFLLLMFAEVLDSRSGRSCFGPLGIGSFSAGSNSPELHSVGFFESEIQDLTTS
jgi:hypothetical protein